ncbi:calmodulin-interacting protein 111 isoform X2 [Telopea speciosissima]|uniref:calmodulin-interacting protein 111 isoform X2 n=1 Tax=Telopea speciosissima TaxID=54955 RepID=UPI001CC758E5|nr:calmodulin-interacting protein 111 isoform X2 [Telopea speciosissima]
MSLSDILVFMPKVKERMMQADTLLLQWFFLLVLKNGVRLSWSLSCTLGFPSFGRIIFISSIQTLSVAGLLNNLPSPINNAACPLTLCKCKDLQLQLISSMDGVSIKHYMSHSNRPAEMDQDQFENGKVSSPKTPSLYKPKLDSPISSQLHSGTRDGSVLKLALGDEKTKELWQSCAVHWLRSRILLPGNIVTIPIFPYTSVFRVEGANESECTNQKLKDEGNDLICQTPRLMDHIKEAFLVDHETKIHIFSSLTSETKTEEKRSYPREDLEHKDFRTTLTSDVRKLGGLSKEFALLKEIIISSSVKDSLSSLGLRTTKGVLLHGPPGTGKTSLAHSCARDTGVNIFSVNGPEVVSQYYGESEQALHEVFDSASKAAPAVVFIDELDAIAPARKDGGEELSQRIVATLLNLMDGINRTAGILIIAATNRPDSIDPALRRPGRLDREIEIGVPSPKQRLDILLILLSEMDHSLLDIQIQHLASTTHGFVGADLAAFCNEAALACLRRYIKFKKSCTPSKVKPDDVPPEGLSLSYETWSADTLGSSDLSKGTGNLFSTENEDSASSSSISDLIVSSEISKASLFCSTVQNSGDAFQNVLLSSVKGTCGIEEEFSLKVAFEDFEKAKMKVRPSAMREVLLEVPKVHWDDVGGQTEVKKQLMEAVEWPQKHQDAFRRIGTHPPTGVLLFGPPGCSKTLMARAVASEAGLNFLAVKGPELFNKWVGESEKAVRSLFAKARTNAPSIVFFDEIDSLAIIRGQENDGASVSDRVMSQLLVELDGLHQRVDVTVIAATNRPDKIDPALLRPGRFDRLLYVGPPNEIDREEIFRIHVRKMPCSCDVSLRELACLTQGCTGADISLICREAAVAAIEESLDASEIKVTHFKTAIDRVQPSEVEPYHRYSARFQRLVSSSVTSDDMVCQASSRKSNWISFWSRLKSVLLLFFRLPAALASSKAS